MSALTDAAAPTRAARPPLRLSHLGDELLARYAASGSERAFAALYERYHQQLYRYCRSILRNEPDAQDALQSTFAGALQALRRGQRNAPLRPWLYRIAHNEAISLVRRRSRDAGDELQDDTLGIGSSVEQEAADRARWRMLVADLAGLPDRQRGALLLRELSGLSHDEIGVALGTSTAGAKQAIFEARQALAEIEEGRAMSCEDIRERISEGDRRVLRGRRVTAHLRECSACEAFALAIPARRTQLRAMTPVLPPVAAAALLSRSLHAASANGAAASGTSAAVASGAIGKATGTALAWKLLAGAALIATTAAGVTGLRHLVHPGHPASHSVPAAQLPPTASPRADSALAMALARHAADGNLLRQGYPGIAPDARRGHGAIGHRGKAARSHGRGHSRSAMGHSRGRSGGRAVGTRRGSGHHAYSSGRGSSSPAHGSTSQTRSGSGGRTSGTTLPLSLPKKLLTIKLPKRRSAVRIHTPSR